LVRLQAPPRGHRWLVRCLAVALLNERGFRAKIFCPVRLLGCLFGKKLFWVLKTRMHTLVMQSHRLRQNSLREGLSEITDKKLGVQVLLIPGV